MYNDSAYHKAYYRLNRDRIRLQQKAYASKTKRDRTRYNHEHHLKTKYGLSQEQWNKLFAIQGNKCAICGTDKFGEGIRGPHTDHCGNAGHIRGILCRSCNTALGHFRHSVKRLKSAIKYMERESLFSTGEE